MYRDLKETCITWDKRVHRGNTYSLYTQNAIKEALQDAVEEPAPKATIRKREREPDIFNLPLPEKVSQPVDLTPHLVAKEVIVEVETAEAQTDEFLPEPPQEQYQPQKIGIDASTQVEDGELFDFDAEVEPILDVLVNKTLEQSLTEVEDAYELDNMKSFKQQWFERQRASMKDWQEQVEAEKKLWKEKNEIMNKQRVVKRQEAQVLLKLQAVAAARKHIKGLVPNTVADIQEMAFPDEREMAITKLFMPQLMQNVRAEVSSLTAARRRVEDLAKTAARSSVAVRQEALQKHREKQSMLDLKHFEELQIRQGRIRILMEDEQGHQIAVGPIQISTQDTVEAIQERVEEWLANHEPAAAAGMWKHGVLLCLEGEPVEETRAIFDAKAGQISMVPKPEPPPPEREEGEEGEEEGEEGGAGADS